MNFRTHEKAAFDISRMTEEKINKIYSKIDDSTFVNQKYV